ncbi:thiopurine S-methyltransferase [Sphaerotilus sp.]|uniref:thiopurine S-methyltransferase n=1 Tax=Sphaerotilus sp. TaxID=2093942 RepID=UPI00286E7543|nr:thiopurine S-methyltransferase [Sphaerotilus sp.]
MVGPSVDFWQQRFEANDIPWDRGAVSPQIAPWLADGTLAVGQRAAVPGCGSGHEVLALVQADVLQWQPSEPLDAVFEQTCWCAIHPDHWADYAAQLHRWLRPGGRLCLMAMQVVRPGAAVGCIEWPAPPYAAVPHPRGWRELAIGLVRR